MLVHLPGGTSIAIDAKAPLSAFLDAQAFPETATGEDGARRAELLHKHVKAVRSHVDALAKKAYWAGLEASPEFVVCFIPSESVLSAALAEDPALLEYAFGKRIALASPVNLWAVLKTVAYSWTQQEVLRRGQDAVRSRQPAVRAPRLARWPRRRHATRDRAHGRCLQRPCRLPRVTSSRHSTQVPRHRCLEAGVDRCAETHPLARAARVCSRAARGRGQPVKPVERKENTCGNDDERADRPPDVRLGTGGSTYAEKHVGATCRILCVGTDCARPVRGRLLRSFSHGDDYPTRNLRATSTRGGRSKSDAAFPSARAARRSR